MILRLGSVTRCSLVGVMLESKAEKLSHARRRRGSVRTSITCMKENIVKLEARKELSSADWLLIPQLVKKVGKVGC